MHELPSNAVLCQCLYITYPSSRTIHGPDSRALKPYRDWGLAGRAGCDQDGLPGQWDLKKVITPSLCKCQPQLALQLSWMPQDKPQVISLIRYSVFQWVVVEQRCSWVRLVLSRKHPFVSELVGGLWCFVWLGFPTWLDIKYLVYHASWCA